MKKISFTEADFVKTAIQWKQYPVLRDLSGNLLPEIAFAGRSNVGKSSLINHLFQKKGLAKVSSTPGKTQMLNFFWVPHQLAFTDLPGYGFAQVPLAVREKWGPMVQTYLEKRETLQLILFLFDIRRLPNEEDLELMRWIQFHHKATILVLTKVDKVKSQEKSDNTRKILKAFDVESLPYVHYSATKNIGRHPLMKYIVESLS